MKLKKFLNTGFIEIGSHNQVNLKKFNSKMMIKKFFRPSIIEISKTKKSHSNHIM